MVAVGLVLGFAGLIPRLRSLDLTKVGSSDGGSGCRARAHLPADNGGGLYWMVPALITGFLTAVTGAWVLLVEIHR